MGSIYVFDTKIWEALGLLTLIFSILTETKSNSIIHKLEQNRISHYSNQFLIIIDS